METTEIVSLTVSFTALTKDENNDIHVVIGEDGKPQKIDQRSKQLKEWIL